jgi:hypothetical protein
VQDFRAVERTVRVHGESSQLRRLATRQAEYGCQRARAMAVVADIPIWLKFVSNDTFSECCTIFNILKKTVNHCDPSFFVNDKILENVYNEDVTT